MSSVALLTYDQFPDLIPADQKLIPLLQCRGVAASPIIWNDPLVDWSQFDFLIFRNTWDYYLLQESFASWLDMIGKLGIPTFNPIAVIRRNKHKFYLKEMRDGGIQIIPSVFIPASDNFDLSSLIPNNWTKAILKPAVSAGSHLTVLFDTSDIGDIQVNYKDIASSHDLILQPFVEEITTQGEISLIFFNKIFSHAVVKMPKDGDFRIQSQFGGKYTAFVPTRDLLHQAQKVVDFIQEDLLYARVDGIEIKGVFHLMELELIEPDLYLDLIPDGQSRFVKAMLDAGLS
jgi:glutathione synthase/RimK-type ligase-like ATP-grasp enzyme